MIVTLANVGEGLLYYNVYAVYDGHETFEGINEVIELSHWDSSSEVSDTIFGSSEEEDVKLLVRFKGPDLHGFIGRTIDRIITNTCSGYVGDTVVLFFPERTGVYGPGTGLGDYVHEVYTDVPEETEYAFELPTPVQITGEELYFGLSFRCQGGESALMLLQDDEESSMDNNYIHHQGENSYGICTDNFYLKAEFSGYSWPEWLSLSSVGGVLDAGRLDDIVVKFNMEMLEVGNTYTAKIVVASVDPENEFIEIPVTLDVVNGVDDAEKFGVLGYPNPVSNVFHVEAESEIESISIINMNGQLVSTLQINNTVADVQLENLPAGIYQLLINLEKQSIVKKIVKE